MRQNGKGETLPFGGEAKVGFYTDVAYYRSWILGAMKQARPNEELVWQEGAAAAPLH